MQKANLSMCTTRIRRRRPVSVFNLFEGGWKPACRPIRVSLTGDMAFFVTPSRLLEVLDQQSIKKGIFIYDGKLTPAAQKVDFLGPRFFNIEAKLSIYRQSQACGQS